MKRLFQSLVTWVELKVDEARQRQAPTESGLDGQPRPPVVVVREPGASSKGRIGIFSSFALIAVILFFGWTPSCHKEKKVAAAASAPQAADPEEVNQNNAFAQRRVKNKEQDALRAIRDKSASQDAPGFPPCTPALANQVFQKGATKLGCVFLTSANRWEWVSATPANTETANATAPGQQYPTDTSQGQQNQPGASGQAPQLSPAQQFEQERLLRYYNSLAAPPIVAAVNQSATLKTASVESPESLSPVPPQYPAQRAASEPQTREEEPEPEDPLNHKAFPYNSAVGPFHVIQRDQTIEAQLDTAIKGEYSGPVKAHLTHPFYLKGTETLLIPAGTPILGKSVAVNKTNQKGLAVSFDQVVFGDGYVLSLDQEMAGGSQDGASGITDRVNNHIVSTFGTALAIGLIGGLSQIGNASNGLSYSPSVAIRNGFSQQAGEESMQILQSRLNRLPEIEIRPGTRINIIPIGDIKHVPEFLNHRMVGRL